MTESGECSRNSSEEKGCRQHAMTEIGDCSSKPSDLEDCRQQDILNDEQDSDSIEELGGDDCNDIRTSLRALKSRGNNDDLTESRPCEIIDTPNGTRLWIPIVADDIRPIVDNIYISFEDAKKVYDNYAYHAGFDTRLSTVKKKKGEITHRYIVCNKAGRAKKKLNVDTLEGTRAKGTTRKRTYKVSDCKAGIKLKCVRGTTSYKLYDFHETHNHPLLEPENMDLSKTRRQLQFPDKQYIHRVCTSNMGPSIAHRIHTLAAGGRQMIRGTAVDYRNFWRDMKVYIGERDAQMLVDKMNQRKDHVPHFSFEYKVDEEVLTGLFWADEIAKLNYKAFGDVLAFDATYGTNKYKMIFVPLTGVDHHKRSVIFAAGLIKSETIESYKWLLQCFLTAHEKQPDLVLTDQDPSMKDVVSSVFTSSVHRLCAWHITQKIPIKMKGKTEANTNLRRAIHKIVWNVHLTAEEFEERWDNVIREYRMSKHKWLSDLYEIREKWIPSFFCHIPMCCLMKTTSRSESSNAMFKVHSNVHNTLVQFMLCYETALEAQRFTQRRMDLETKSTTPSLNTHLPIEKFAAAVYTHRMFTEVQKEIWKGVWACSQKNISIEDGVYVCLIKDKDKERQLKSEFKVTLNMKEETVECCCNKYVRIGYLCRHIFCVLKDRGVDAIPEKYLHKRWKRQALPEDILKRHESYRTDNDRSNALMNESISVVESCASRLRGDLNKLNEFVDKLKKLESDFFANEPKDPPENSKEEIFNSLLGVTPPRKILFKAPKGIKNKGRKRLVGGGEKDKAKRKKQKRQCKYCGKYYHDTRTCLKRKRDLKKAEKEKKRKAAEEKGIPYESESEEKTDEEESDEEETEDESEEEESDNNESEDTD